MTILLILCLACPAWAGRGEGAGAPYLEAEIYDGENYEMSAKLYQTVGDPLAEDLPLRPWTVIAQRLEQAVSTGRMSEVYLIRLGYVLLMDWEKSGNYITVPAWGVHAMPDSLITQIKEEKWSAEALEAYRKSQQANARSAALYLNAQTGEWIKATPRDTAALYGNRVPWAGVQPGV